MSVHRQSMDSFKLRSRKGCKMPRLSTWPSTFQRLLCSTETSFRSDHQTWPRLLWLWRESFSVDSNLWSANGPQTTTTRRWLLCHNTCTDPPQSYSRNTGPVQCPESRWCSRSSSRSMLPLLDAMDPLLHLQRPHLRCHLTTSMITMAQTAPCEHLRRLMAIATCPLRPRSPRRPSNPSKVTTIITLETKDSQQPRASHQLPHTPPSTTSLPTINLISSLRITHLPPCRRMAVQQMSYTTTCSTALWHYINTTPNLLRDLVTITGLVCSYRNSRLSSHLDLDIDDRFIVPQLRAHTWLCAPHLFCIAKRLSIFYVTSNFSAAYVPCI